MNAKKTASHLSGTSRGTAILLLAILTAGGLFVWWMVARADREMRAVLLQQARLVVQTVEIERVQALSGTEADLDNPQYRRFKEQFAAVRSANPQCRFVYLMGRKADGTVFIFVDSEPADSKDYSPPGQIYPEVPEGYRRVFATRAEAVVGPVTDRWGVWVSALVPLTDPHTGAVVTVLGMDVAARAWKWDVAARAALPAGLMLVLLIGVVTVFAAARRVDTSPKPVLRRLLPPLTVMVVLLVAGAGALLWHQHQQELAREIATDSSDAIADLRTALDQQAIDLAAVAQPIAADAAVQKTLRASDADRLLAAWRPVFEKLHREIHLTHFYFLDANRVCLLRVHEPEIRGDRIEHFTVIKTERIGKTASGLELGSQGTLTLRVVQPVFEGGTLAGYVELGKEIADALQTLQIRSGNQLAVVIRKELLNRQSWEESMRLVGRQTDWDRLPRSVVIYASQGRLPDAFASWADRAGGEHTYGEMGREIAFDGRDWRVVATPLPDASGKEVGDLLMMRDVSAEKADFARLLALGGTAGAVLLALLLGFIYVLLGRTDRGLRAQQEGLRESKARFEQLAEQSGTIAWEVDDQGLYSYVSDVSEAIWGYRPDELVGQKHFYDLHPESGREVFKTTAFAVFARKEPFQNLVNATQTKDGRLVWVSTNGISLLHADGTLRGYRGSDTDITERKRAEEALRESESSLRESQVIAGLGSYVLDFATGFWKSSDVLDTLFGIDETYERSVEGWAALTHPDDRTVMVDYLKNEVLGQGQAFDREYRIIRHDTQAERWVHGLGKLEFDAGGRPVKMRGTIQDITDHRRAEAALEQSRAQLVQAQKMEAVGRLAGGVAHDFNNILQALLSLATVLRLRAPSPELAETVAEIEALIRRGAGLTQQLLLFSRREISKTEPLDLGELAGASGVLLRRLIPANIHLTVETTPELLWIKGDAGQLQQVIMNLAVNARDAMPSGGTLTVRAFGIGGEAVLEVADTGHGMDEESRAHLFEPFFTTKEKGKGTGLGLSVVHGIVKQHGGRIEVDSSPGVGSRFRVVLPEVLPSGERAGAVAGADGELPLGHGEHVLVVEDEEGARKGLVEVLEYLDYTVTAVGSGEEAGVLPADLAPDLLLSDLMLPGIAGSDLAVGLRERWPSLKVILMSGYTEDEAVRRGVDKGKVRFLQKPFDMTALAREARAALDEQAGGVVTGDGLDDG